MTFAVAGAAYDRFMGRYLPTLAPAFADVAGVTAGQRALDVGCGPGGLTGELVARLGAEAVSAVDPSPPFVEACRARHPGVDVRQGVAEELPFADDAFDVTLASLVVSFMRDADAGAREMARVTTPGGTVGACMWDGGRDGMPMLDAFWRAASTLDPTITGERHLRGRSEGELAELLTAAGLTDVEEGSIAARAAYDSFEDLWEPFTFGVGPAGAYVARIDADRRDALRRACRVELGEPDGPFELEARAWYARGRVG